MTTTVADRSAHRTAEAVARRSYGKLVALLASSTRDLAAAEDALADAFAAALADWPAKGCPENPEAWLLAVARRKRIDAARKEGTAEGAAGSLRILAEEKAGAREAAGLPDRRLALLFACAHPALEEGVRAPLMLQAVLGLSALRIASAFLTSPAAMGKRLVRAKDKIREAGIPFRAPEREELPGRLAAVLDAVYAAFTEGWSDAEGTDAVRRDLAEEALFLARLVAELLPEEPEALGLLALLLHAEARRTARRGEAGEYVPLSEQDLESWDWPKILEAEDLIRRAAALTTPGRYQIEAALQSAHVDRHRNGIDNRAEVVHLYDALETLNPTPIIALNRALAVADLEGAERGLAALPDSETDPRLVRYQPYWAARAELLARAGRPGEAARAYDRAIGLESDPAVRGFLQRRQAALRGSRS